MGREEGRMAVALSLGPFRHRAQSVSQSGRETLRRQQPDCAGGLFGRGKGPARIMKISPNSFESAIQFAGTRLKVSDCVHTDFSVPSSLYPDFAALTTRKENKDNVTVCDSRRLPAQVRPRPSDRPEKTNMAAFNRFGARKAEQV